MGGAGVWVMGQGGRGRGRVAGAGPKTYLTILHVALCIHVKVEA